MKVSEDSEQISDPRSPSSARGNTFVEISQDAQDTIDRSIATVGNLSAMFILKNFHDYRTARTVFRLPGPNYSLITSF
jgi:hypothetical protein